MLNAAKNSKKLYDDLIELGFGDTEFPEWWYSPARAVKVAVVAVPSSDELPGAQDELSVAKGAQLSSEKKLHEPILPRNPSPRDRVPGRPAIAELSTAELVTPPDSSTELRTAEHSSFSDEEINLLASNNVYRSPDSGEWFHREEYPDGRLMITPVNPNAELRRARGKTPPLTLVPFIRCARFEDDEFPNWWYSPDRNVEQPPNAVRARDFSGVNLAAG